MHVRPTLAIAIGVSLAACGANAPGATTSATAKRPSTAHTTATVKPGANTGPELAAKAVGTAQTEDDFGHLVIAANGKNALAYSRETLVRYDLASGNVTIAHSASPIEAAALSPDGTLALIAGATLTIADTPIALPKNRIPKRIAYSTDGRAFVLAHASSNKSGEQRLLVIDAGKVTQDTRLTASIPTDDCDLRVNDRGDIVLLAECGDIDALRVKDSAELLEWGIGGEKYKNFTMVEVAPGSFAFTWETDGGDRKTGLAMPGFPHATVIDASGNCGLSADGRLIACVTTGDKNVVIRETTTLTERARTSAPAPIDRLAFTADGKTLVGALHDGRFLTVDTAATLAAAPAVELAPSAPAVALDASKPTPLDVLARPFKATRTLKASERPLSLIASPDQKHLLVAVLNGVELLDVPSGRRSDVIMEPYVVADPGLAWSPDGASIVEADHDREQLRVFTRGTAEPRTLGKVFGNLVAWSSKGVIATRAEDFTQIQLWDANGAHGKVLAAPAQEFPLGFAFSPDGSLLLTWGQGAVVAWNPQTGRLTHALSAHAGGVITLTWAPDGSKFATIGRDHAVIVWDATSLVPITVIHATKGGGLAFSPDGNRLAIRGTDISIWSIPDGTPLSRYTMANKTADPTLIAWLPEGLVVAAGDANVGLLAAP